MMGTGRRRDHTIVIPRAVSTHNRAMPRALIATVVLASLVWPSRVLGAPAAPSGPHPRLFLDADTTQALKAEATQPDSAVARAISDCEDVVSNPADHSGGGWAGFDFVAALVPCLVAYRATGDASARAGAVEYLGVLLDDKDEVGDGLGGDDVVRHDTGYFMRTFGAYAPLAYDWLFDAPELTRDLKDKALERMRAWTDWYGSEGYLNDVPAANYHAGYVFAATMTAIATGGELGDDDALWSKVVDQIWGQDLAAALAPGGVLEGGDWPEGWQYGPLSVAEYALSAHALNQVGVETPGLEAWLRQAVTRQHYALLPAAPEHFIAGDNDSETVYTSVSQVWLSAVLASSRAEETRVRARAIMRKAGLDFDADLFGVLGSPEAPAPVDFPDDLATSYLAPGAGNYYVRSGWTAADSYAVTQCTRQRVPDHTGHKSTNFVLSLGADHLVIDPAPYGSDTLASNAVGIDYGRSESEYTPFQTGWNEDTHYDWQAQTRSGVAAVRCDYQDAFRITWEDTSTVLSATRDWVYWPRPGAVTLVVLDDAELALAGQLVHLRFRSLAPLSTDGTAFTGTVGESTLRYEILSEPEATSTVTTLTVGDYCDYHDAACQLTTSRVPADQLAVDVPGPVVHVTTVIDGTPADAATPAAALALSGDGYRGVSLARDDDRLVVVQSDSAASTLEYRTAATGGLHVVLAAPASGAGLSDVTARSDGADCVVRVVAHGQGDGGTPSRPLVFRLGTDCALAEEDAVVPVLPDGDDVGAGGSRSQGGGDTGAASAVAGAGGAPAGLGGAGTNDRAGSAGAGPASVPDERGGAGAASATVGSGGRGSVNVGSAGEASVPRGSAGELGAEAGAATGPAHALDDGCGCRMHRERAPGNLAAWMLLALAGLGWQRTRKMPRPCAR
jgi:MYXO-CTERM domain-containing protein